MITSLGTKNSYTIGDKIGEGNFGIVYSCKDFWNNDLAAKVLKPTGTYEKVRASAEDELKNWLHCATPTLRMYLMLSSIEILSTSLLSDAIVR